MHRRALLLAYLVRPLDFQALFLAFFKTIDRIIELFKPRFLTVGLIAADNKPGTDG